MNKEPMNKRPEDWTLAERFKILLESSALEGEALNAFCHRKGLCWRRLKIDHLEGFVPIEF
jgi:hypothetical protein